MGKVYKDYEQNQMLLLPPSLRDWLPEGHLAFFISDTVDQLDISAIQNEYEKELQRLPTLPSTHDAEDPGVRLLCWGAFFPQDSKASRGRCGVPVSCRRQYAQVP